MPIGKRQPGACYRCILGRGIAFDERLCKGRLIIVDEGAGKQPCGQRGIRLGCVGPVGPIDGQAGVRPDETIEPSQGLAIEGQRRRSGPMTDREIASRLP